MVSQNCPKCHSSHIRRGYRPTPVWKKIFGRYNLLCDSCNLEFWGFAVPGTVTRSRAGTKKKRESDSVFESAPIPLGGHVQPPSPIESQSASAPGETKQTETKIFIPEKHQSKKRRKRSPRGNSSKSTKAAKAKPSKSSDDGDEKPRRRAAAGAASSANTLESKD